MCDARVVRGDDGLGKENLEIGGFVMSELGGLMGS